MRKETVKTKIESEIINSKNYSFLRKEFNTYGSKTTIDRVIKTLLEEGVLVRIGIGIYVKSKKSKISGKIIPQTTIYEAAVEVFEKMGIEIKPNKSTIEYNLGISTQIPATNKINIGKRHITRKISFGKSVIKYERD